MEIDVLAYELKYKGDEMVMALLDAYKEKIYYRNSRIVAKQDEGGGE